MGCGPSVDTSEKIIVGAKPYTINCPANRAADICPRKLELEKLFRDKGKKNPFLDPEKVEFNPEWTEDIPRAPAGC